MSLSSVSVSESNGQVKPIGGRQLVAVIATETIVEISGAVDKVPTLRLQFLKLFSNGSVEAAQGQPDDIASWLEARGWREVGAADPDGFLAIVWVSPYVTVTLAEVGQHIHKDLQGATVKFYRTDATRKAHLDTSLSKSGVRRLRTRNPNAQINLAIQPIPGAA